MRVCRLRTKRARVRRAKQQEPLRRAVASFLGAPSMDDGDVLVPYAADTVDDDSPEARALALYITRSDSRDWNARFQALLQRDTDLEARSVALRTLSREFGDEAVRVCTTIARELRSPQPTIPSIASHGVAGGVKYLHAGIFVKMASRDWRNIYGSAARSIKAASHELVSTMAYLDLRVAGLHFPLMCLVLFRGEGFLCQSVVPIDPVSNLTLVHGSCDGGISVRNSNKAVEAKLKTCAERLNLQPHAVLSRDRTHMRTLYAAADMEAHVGLDGRVYILDTARAFPPTAPRGKAPKAGHYLFQHLRPELVQRYTGGPLNPDAFSNFRSGNAVFDSASQQRVADATLYLENVAVPQYAAWLDRSHRSSAGSLLDEGATLVSTLHEHGINVRYLCVVLQHVRVEQNRLAIASEVVSRVVKHRVWEAWRSLAGGEADDHLYCASAADSLASVFGPAADAFWTEQLHAALGKDFVAPTQPELLPAWWTLDWRPTLGSERMAALLLRTLASCGVELRASARRVGAAFACDDVERIVARVKHLSRIAFEEALCCSRMAEGAPSDEQAAALFLRAVRGFEEVLASRADYRAAFNLCLSLSRLARLELRHPAQARARYTVLFEQCRRAVVLSDGDWRMSFLFGSSLLEAAMHSDFSATERLELLAEAEQHLRAACTQSEGGSQTHYNLANCLVHRGRALPESQARASFVGACEHFEQALQLAPADVATWANLAVARAKVARLSREPERARWFRSSLEAYRTAATASGALEPSRQLLFDWANTLFRFGKESGGHECLKQAAFRYARVLEMAPDAGGGDAKLGAKEPWYNLGVTLEALAPQGEDDLVPLVVAFCQLAHLDATRAATTMRRLARSPNARIVAAAQHSQQQLRPQLQQQPARPSPSQLPSSDGSPVEVSPRRLDWRSGSDDSAPTAGSSTDTPSPPPPAPLKRRESFLARSIRSLSKAFGKSPLGPQLDWSAARAIWSPHLAAAQMDTLQLTNQAISLDAGSASKLALMGTHRVCVKVVAAASVDRACVEAYAMVSASNACPYLVRLLGVHW